MRNPVEKERGRRYIGLPEFAQAGERALSELQLEQERGTVTNVPDERTIRYYLAEGLIQTPEERQGTASVFGYLNLLQLLTVKKLQAEHLPIRKIRELVSGKSEPELETLLGVGSASSDKASASGKKSRESEARRYLESLLTGSKSQAVTSVLASSPSPPPAATKPVAPPKMAADASLAQHADQTHSWHRVEIEPGLELHIRSDYSPPATLAKIRSLTERVITRIQSPFRGRK